MIREINYRAWNNTNNEWLNENDADLLTIHLDGTYEIDRGWMVEYPDLTLEQDTGLKDKNGKKIYEGDIVKQNISKLAYPVVFEYGGFLPFTADMMIFDSDYCEVIGNIHENPELLIIE